MLAGDLVRALEDLVDGVGAVVRRRGEDVAVFEVNDLDDAVALETDRAGELLASQLDEPFNQIDLADFAFDIIVTDLRLPGIDGRVVNDKPYTPEMYAVLDRC